MDFGGLPDKVLVLAWILRHQLQTLALLFLLKIALTKKNLSNVELVFLDETADHVGFHLQLLQDLLGSHF